MGEAEEDVAGAEGLLLRRVVLPFCLGAYIANSNGPSTITRVPLWLCEKRVELQGLRVVGLREKDAS